MGTSEDYVKYMTNLNPNFELAKEIPSPPELMDCRRWHDIREEIKEKVIQNLTITNPSNPLIPFLRNSTSCKDDCQFCSSTTIEPLDNEPFDFNCVGPDDMKIIIDFPRNTCKDFNSKEIQEILRKSGLDITGLPQEIKGKICTCSEDGCNNNLKCYVGFTKEYVKHNRLLDPSWELPKQIPSPPRLMDCEMWHDVQKKAMEELMSPSNKNNPLRDSMNSTHWCKQDCKFCVSGYDWSLDGHFAETCAGREKMNLVKEFPENTCKSFDFRRDMDLILGNSWLDSGNNKLISTHRYATDYYKICTCSQDGCNMKPGYIKDLTTKFPQKETTKSPQVGSTTTMATKSSQEGSTATRNSKYF